MLSRMAIRHSALTPSYFCDLINLLDKIDANIQTSTFSTSESSNLNLLTDEPCDLIILLGNIGINV